MPPSDKTPYAKHNAKPGPALSRRRWLRELIPMAVEAVATVAPILQDSPGRPPGARPEEEFLAKCNRCGDCATACPYGTIFIFDENQGNSAGTPVLFVEERPCRQCRDYACAAACDTGALCMPGGKQPRLGGARIVQSRCLPFKGPECGACRGMCPGAAALQLTTGRPRIDPDLCTGCGMCIAACPTSPPAIEATL